MAVEYVYVVAYASWAGRVMVGLVTKDKAKAEAFVKTNPGYEIIEDVLD